MSRSFNEGFIRSVPDKGKKANECPISIFACPPVSTSSEVTAVADDLDARFAYTIVTYSGTVYLQKCSNADQNMNYMWQISFNQSFRDMVQYKEWIYVLINDSSNYVRVNRYRKSDGVNDASYLKTGAVVHCDRLIIRNDCIFVTYYQTADNYRKIVKMSLALVEIWISSGVNLNTLTYNHVLGIASSNIVIAMDSTGLMQVYNFSSGAWISTIAANGIVAPTGFIDDGVTLYMLGQYTGYNRIAKYTLPNLTYTTFVNANTQQQNATCKGVIEGGFVMIDSYAIYITNLDGTNRKTQKLLVASNKTVTSTYGCKRLAVAMVSGYTGNPSSGLILNTFL